ncbi:DctP family TRAP transporter solute-binding subunit [Acuticoccus kandeliae]|uniref:DctP family TRAP transporter solute-binding subunit n=1 Tax=Acuticoccus kandeliae TaxID=2073160 RepID=UPI000D3EDACE|nr:DctP family TRAP transporter solute-binding subunit [Acuticoccus kandeliae]
MNKFFARTAIAGLTVLGAVSFANAETLRVGHILSEAHPTHVALTEMAEAMEAESNGDLTMEVFANGILGTHLELISQVKDGALDMALIPGISPFQGLDPRLGVEEIPFLFDSHEAAYAAVDGPFGDKVAEILTEKGLHTLAFWENGFRNFTNNVRPIVTPEDMKGIRFRSDTSKMRLAMFEEMGASAIGMSFAELFTGLQQGVVDGQENPLSIINSAKFFEVQDYLSLSGHLWGAAVLIINSAVYDRLSDEQKALLTKMSETYRDREREMIVAEDERLVKELADKGMQVNEVDREAMRAATAGVRDIYIKANGDELLRLINGD